MGCRFVGNFRGEVMKVGAELFIFVADLRELGGNGVQLGRNNHNTGECSAEN